MNATTQFQALTSKQVAMKLQQALARYVTQLRANGRSEHTVLQAQRHVRLLARWLDHERRATELDAIDEHTLAEFLTSDTACRSARGGTKTPGSMNALRASTRAFFGHAARADWLERDPARLIKRAICSPPPPRALNGDEQQRLLAVLNNAAGAAAQRDTMLFTFLLTTGVRLSCALGIVIDDVDVVDRTVLLRTMKGCDMKRIFMPSKTALELEKYLAGRMAGPVFSRLDGQRLSARHAQRRFRMWREKAGIQDGVTVHSLRHSFALRLYEMTGDVLLVKEALGHRSISSTLVYAQCGPKRLRAVLV